MDFIEGLPMSDGKDNIFAIVDRLTKYTHFMAIKKTDTTKQIAEMFCKKHLQTTWFFQGHCQL